jgi:hypothetical protein
VKARKPKPKRSEDKPISLYPAKFEDVVKALLQTNPPRESKKTKRRQL